jgi:hypothetical protein
MTLRPRDNSTLVHRIAEYQGMPYQRPFNTALRMKGFVMNTSNGYAISGGGHCSFVGRHFFLHRNPTTRRGYSLPDSPDHRKGISRVQVELLASST